MKIKTKLILLLGVMVIIVALLIGVVYSRTTSLVSNLANANADSNVRYLVDIIDFYFTGLENIPQNAITGVKAFIDETDGSADKARLQAMLVELTDLNKDENLIGAYMGFEADGSFTSGDDWDPPSDYDSRERDWYKGAVAKRGTYVSEPYEDAAYHIPVITIAVPVYTGTDNKLAGVFAVDVSTENLAAKIRGAAVLGAGFGVLLAPDGLVVEHPDKSFILNENLSKSSAKVGSDLAAVGRKMISGGIGHGEYAMQGDSRNIFYGSSKSGYIAAIVFPNREQARLVSGVTMIQLIAGGIAIVIVLIYMTLMIPSITKPLRAVQATLERMASLDLTPDREMSRFTDGLSEKTELGAMVASLSNMRNVFTDVLDSVRAGVEQLTASSGMLDELSQNANSEVDNSKSAASTVEQLAQDALRSVESTTNAVEEVSHAATMTATSATQGAEASSTTSKLSAQVSEMVNGFVSELQNVGNASMENSKGMTEVGDSVAAIGEFVTSIRTIASQTNLLALNAAIEAARAGDAGRGFAVVADEVRKLAEESNVASRHVSEMMEKLESGTKNAISSSQESANIITQIIGQARATQESLKNATAEIDKVNDAVQTIAAAAQEQAASSNEIAESSGQAKDSIGNVAREISSVARAAAETQEAIQKVTVEASNLSAISSELENLLARFTISEENVPKLLKAEAKRTLPPGRNKK
ncbi:MAG: methyl-accepting chemotaxis protein [Synergistaceae bacterium]|jgi:methyl-accepting chemotaxis protein|nr:methyl-accepting chemotaxis protein [Synergistaceae bacterium]